METLCHLVIMKWYERAKQIMDENGITPADMQRRMGESQSNVSRWLNGTRGPDSITAATKFARALGLSLSDLVFEGMDRKSNEKTESSITKARTVLNSGVDQIASALTWNIEAFSHAVRLEHDVQELRRQVAELQKFVTREVAEPPVTSEPDQPPLGAPTSGPRRRITIQKPKAV